MLEPPPPKHTYPPTTKLTHLELKTLSPHGAFEGYASVFGREDLGHDIVLSGAFRATLANRRPNAVKMLFQHDPCEPIGVWDVLREDAKGLFVQGRLLLDVARAREIFTLMRAGALNGLSIGYRAVKSRRDRPSAPRKIMEIDLWEISVVTFPMQPEARIDTIKTTRSFAPHRLSERHVARSSVTEPELAAKIARLTAAIRSATPTLPLQP